MATKITQSSYTHALRIPTELYKWIMAQKQNPSESFSQVILRILWDRKNSEPGKKSHASK
jgi:predicted CopG family antitoxin